MPVAVEVAVWNRGNRNFAQVPAWSVASVLSDPPRSTMGRGYRLERLPQTRKAPRGVEVESMEVQEPMESLEPMESQESAVGSQESMRYQEQRRPLVMPEPQVPMASQVLTESRMMVSRMMMESQA